MALVTPGILGVTGPVDTSLGTASPIRHSCTGLQYSHLLLRVHLGSAGAVWLGVDERREETGEETDC